MLRAIGLMSGTSLDGVDVALIETDGNRQVVAGPSGSWPYIEADRTTLRAALAAARDLQDRTARPQPLAEAERLINERHAEAVHAFLDEHGISPGAIDLVGFHGQTVVHRPERRLTIQIGDGATLARALGVPVVADMRAADVAAGGQGAPLVPAYHRALVAAAGWSGGTLVINVGGVANVTLVAGDADPVAFDTGPGNALLDDLMLERTGAAVDRDGATAASGHVDQGILQRLLAHPFFAQPAPKSLDRDDFSRTAVDGLPTGDAAATLTAFTAASIARALEHLPSPPAQAVVCGGGARNPTLMRMLDERLPCRVRTADACGWQGDAIEAQAFAYLAVRSRAGLPLTFPSTTGVPHPMPGGVTFRP